MICILRGLWGTITMLEFWKSLFVPPLVTYSGHIWPDSPIWSNPELSRFPDVWEGMIEYDISSCIDCGYQPKTDWRRVWLT